MEIKLVLFFETVTTNGWWETLEVFGQRIGTKALILCGGRQKDCANPALRQAQ